MDEVVQILNRRNRKRKGDCYERRNRRRLTDEYYVIWRHKQPTWEKFAKLCDRPEFYEPIREFEKFIKTYHKSYQLGNGKKPILATALGQHCGNDIFACMFLGSTEFAPVPASKLYEYCPEVAIKFFERHLKIKNHKAVIEIPLSMQNKVGRLFNKMQLQQNISLEDSIFENNSSDDDYLHNEDVLSDDGYGCSNFYEDYEMMLCVCEDEGSENDEEELWEQVIFDLYYRKSNNDRFYRDFLFRQKILLNRIFSIDEVD